VNASQQTYGDPKRTTDHASAETTKKRLRPNSKTRTKALSRSILTVRQSRHSCRSALLPVRVLPGINATLLNGNAIRKSTAAQRSADHVITAYTSCLPPENIGLSCL
jgi:hypothetical protein